MWEQIQEMLSRLGISGRDPWQHTPESIAGSLQKKYGIGETLPSAAFKPLTESMFQQTKSQAYSPLLQSKQSSYVTDLLKQYDTSQMGKMYGGFAGSGARDVYGKSLMGGYKQKMAGDIAGIETQKLGAQKNIMDIIDSWSKAAMSFKT